MSAVGRPVCKTGLLDCWGEIFGDQVLATAILDRLLHHATTLNIKGESYRLKGKRKAGLLGKAPRTEAADAVAAGE